MSSLNFCALSLFISLAPFIVFHFHDIEVNSLIDSKYGKALTNETFIEDPSPQNLVKAVSNGLYLSSYMKPKITDLIIKEGSWTIENLSEAYPDFIEKKTSENAKQVFLIKKSIVIEKNAELKIVNSTILLTSLPKKDNTPAVLITFGKAKIVNSTISSWDPQQNRPDSNPYHPRPFLVAKDGGTMDVIGSTINYLGFSLAGTHTLISSLAALDYYNTSSFIIANSTISNNLYGFYSDESSNFKIVDNEVYANIGYGLDPHSGSNNFIIDSNHVFANGKQGIICSFRCENASITNNKVHYNIEGIGLHWLTNSSIVKNNDVKYNKGYGIYVKTNSHKNLIMNNTIIGNGNGIGLLDNSNENVVRLNVLRGNILDKNQIYEHNGSQSNLIEDNINIIK